MALTTEQLPALKAAILAETDPGFVELRDSGATGALATFYNTEASPAFYLWQANYTRELIATAVENGITQLDALTASKRDSLLWWVERSHDMRTSVCQTAVNDLCGSQNVLKNAILDGGKRKVRRGERIFCSGTGSLASPGTSTYEGTISDYDVIQAVNLP